MAYHHFYEEDHWVGGVCVVRRLSVCNVECTVGDKVNAVRKKWRVEGNRQKTL